MNIYLISQSQNSGYDTYDSAVVAAESEYAAARIHPGDYMYQYDEEAKRWYRLGTGVHNLGQRYYATGPNSSWVFSVADVDVHYLGIASNDLKAGVICASFNAG